MPQAPNSPEVSGPRQRKLSEKANTNGDPIVERKKNKLASTQKMDAAPPTKKIIQSSAKTTASAKTPLAKTATATKTMAPAKKTTTFARVAPIVGQAGPSKQRQRPAVEIEEVDDESDSNTSSVPPCNPRHVLEATDGSDDDIEGPEAIVTDVDEGIEEEPEEDDEAELSRRPYSIQKLF